MTANMLGVSIQTNNRSQRIVNKNISTIKIKEMFTMVSGINFF